MNNSTKHKSERVSGCSLLRKRRCLVWPVLAALMLPWTGWDLPATQAYAQRHVEKPFITVGPQVPVMQPAPAANGGYADLVVAQQLTTEVELAIILHLTQPLDVKDPSCCNLPSECEETRQEHCHACDCPPFSSKTRESPAAPYSPPTATKRFSVAMVGPEVDANPPAAWQASEGSSFASRPELFRCGLIARFQILKNELHPLAGEVIRASLGHLDLQRHETSRSRLLPDAGSDNPQPARQVSELATTVPSWSSGKTAATAGRRSPQWFGPARKISGIIAAGLAQQRYCLLHHANGPPRHGIGIVSDRHKAQSASTLTAPRNVLPYYAQFIASFHGLSQFPSGPSSAGFNIIPIHSPEVTS